MPFTHLDFAAHHHTMTSMLHPSQELSKLLEWTGHLSDLGINTLSLGPVFKSSRHGYDTADYFHIDRRLGTREQFSELCSELHRRGFRVMLDGVFNHVGRDFWAFRELRSHPESSPYADWFAGFQPGKRSPFGDPFWYEGWNNHFELVKLNLRHPAVRDHLFQAVNHWMDDYQIDGLRLDAADALDLDFVHALADMCHQKRPDFWMWGEIIHGDYNRWAGPGMLNSITNYECYKGLHSSLNDRNYFEIAYALKRQSGSDGIYKNIRLYNFVDNHDVNRVASELRIPAHLNPLYTLLLSMPGVPAIYYGSEWGLRGKRTPYSDQALRPRLDLPQTRSDIPEPDLPNTLKNLISIRKGSPAIRQGDYRELLVQSEQLAFSRSFADETIIVVLNAAQGPIEIDITLPDPVNGKAIDLLNRGEAVEIKDKTFHTTVPACWGRIFKIGQPKTRT